MSPLIENERTKLTANALNTVAMTCIAVGVIAPVAGSFYSTEADHIPIHVVVIGVVLWGSAGLFLHRQARRVLKGLRE